MNLIRFEYLCVDLICFCLGAGSDSGERSLKFLVGTTDAQKSDAKDQQEVQWHSRFALSLHLLGCDFIIYILVSFI